jgi:hypothetical protein
MAKKYDVVATVGEYTDGQGQQKKRYLNVGAVMSNDNGFYLLLDKTFNPAGLAEPGKGSILLSMFEPKPRDNQQQGQQPQQNQQKNNWDDSEPPF